MVAEVYAGISAVKAAFDLAKGFERQRHANVANSVLLKLQQKILTAQQEQAESLAKGTGVTNGAF